MFLQVALHLYIYVGDKICPALGRHRKITGMEQQSFSTGHDFDDGWIIHDTPQFNQAVRPAAIFVRYLNQGCHLAAAASYA